MPDRRDHTTPSPFPQASLDVIIERVSRIDGALRDHAADDEDRYQRVGQRFDRMDAALGEKAARETVVTIDTVLRSTREDMIRGFTRLETTSKVVGAGVGVAWTAVVVLIEWLAHRGH